MPRKQKEKKIEDIDINENFLKIKISREIKITNNKQILKKRREFFTPK